MVWKRSRDCVVLKRYVADDYFISQTCTTLNMAESTEQNFERDRKNCLLSLDFYEISEIFVEDETIESFVQDATTKVSFLYWLVQASSSQTQE